MKKADVVQRLAERAGLSAADAAAAVEALFAAEGGIISQALAGGASVELGDFGTFDPRFRVVPRRPGSGEGDLGMDEGPPSAPVFRPGAGWRNTGARLRGGRRNPNTGSTGPRRGEDEP